MVKTPVDFSGRRGRVLEIKKRFQKKDEAKQTEMLFLNPPLSRVTYEDGKQKNPSVDQYLFPVYIWAVVRTTRVGPGCA